MLLHFACLTKEMKQMYIIPGTNRNIQVFFFKSYYELNIYHPNTVLFLRLGLSLLDSRSQRGPWQDVAFPFFFTEPCGNFIVLLQAVRITYFTLYSK